MLCRSGHSGNTGDFYLHLNVVLRFIPALCGSLITPTVYLIMVQMKLSPYAGALAGLMVVFDTAILAQSRFILMESMMIFLGLSAVLCVLKFRSLSSQPFTAAWFTWLRSPNIFNQLYIIFLFSLTAFLTGAAFCVKYIGIYTGFLVTFLLFQVSSLVNQCHYTLVIHPPSLSTVVTLPFPRTSGVCCPTPPCQTASYWQTSGCGPAPWPECPPSSTSASSGSTSPC